MGAACGTRELLSPTVALEFKLVFSHSRFSGVDLRRRHVLAARYPLLVCMHPVTEHVNVVVVSWCARVC